MKTAFLFTTTSIDDNYAHLAYEIIFPAILNIKASRLNTLILVGDILPRWKQLFLLFIEKHSRKYDNDLWSRLSPERDAELIASLPFAMCFESISKELCIKLNNKLEKNTNYIGAIEVDDRNDLLYGCFSGSLVSEFKLSNNQLQILSPDEEGINEALLQFLSGLGFNKVTYEFTGLQYTGLDSNHTRTAAQNNASWRFDANNMLLELTDSIVARLLDAAPDLGNKLLAAFDTFQKAETPEHLAQVMSTCRRIFEHVTDSVLPASDQKDTGHKLGKQQYKNRLFQFAEDARKSDTNINLIGANTSFLFEQWDKLYALANKGVHAEVYMEETKRCMIRTILLLDDIISLRVGPFETKIKLNAYFHDMIKEIIAKHKKS